VIRAGKRRYILRVIAGTRRGFPLRYGRGRRFRPTSQIVKGSVFDTLGHSVEGASFLDLFAGSGAVGIEALSRGGRRAVFVEQDPKAIDTLRSNLSKCGFRAEEASVVRSGALRYIQRMKKGELFFGIIFADPPYASDLAQRVLEGVEDIDRRICDTLVVEHDSILVPRMQGVLEKTRTKKFGQTMISYYRYKT